MMGMLDDLEPIQASANVARPAPPASPAPAAAKSILDDLEPVAVAGQPRMPVGAMESIQAGLQASAGGLAWRGKLPDLVMNPEHSKWWERALTGIAQVGAELPLMAAGAIAGAPAGAAIGTAVTGPAAPVGAAVGGILGAGAGMFGVPAALRETLIQSYKSGEVKTVADFWNILREVAQTTVKEAAIGAATMGAGSVAARVVGKAIAPSIGTGVSVGTATKAIGTADVAAQIATMTTMPAAFQGRLPDLQEIMDAAIVVGGLKAAHTTATRITNTFIRTGKTPAEQVADAQANPTIAEDLATPITGTTSGVPIKLDRLIAEAQFLARGGAPMAPNIRAIVRDIKESGPLQGDMVRDLDRLEGLAAKVEGRNVPEVNPETGRIEIKPGTPEPLTTAEVAEVEALRGRLETAAVTLEPPTTSGRRITAEERDASAARLHDDILRQLREADRARQDAGITPLGDEHAQAVAALVRSRARTRAERMGVLPEELYADRPLKIRDETEVARAEAEAAIPPDAPRFTPPEFDLFGNPVVEAPVPRYGVEGLEIVHAPLADLKLSDEVPNFKAAANKKGVVVPLGGKPDLIGFGPIQIWERLDGTREVISGRHRLDLFQRHDMETIPAQIHREADGFTAKDAATLDAKLNIREEQGSVADFAQYFKASGITKEAADAEGLLARAKGRAGFAIARDASPDVLAAHSAGLLSDDAALAISTAAPGVAPLQALGMAVVNDGKSILMAVNMMKAVGTMAAERAGQGGGQADMFGFDDTAMREAEAMAKKASARQRKISEQISAVSGAARRPETARAMGVDVKDPEAIKNRIVELKQEQYQWDNWPLYPELVAKLREGDLGQEPVRPAPGVGELSPEALARDEAAIADLVAKVKSGEITNEQYLDGLRKITGHEISKDTLFQEEYSLAPETPSELKARDAEAAAQAKRKAAQEAAGLKGPLPTVDQADLFNTQGALFQSETKGTWYSELGRQIDASTMKAAPAKGWKDAIKGMVSKGTVKQAEVEAVGLNDWLDLQQGRVTREQVGEFLRENGVKVEDVTLGTHRGLTSDERRTLNTLSDIPVIERSDAQEAELQRLREFGLGTEHNLGAAKFAKYQLPGGQNYRELLLTLPEKDTVTREPTEAPRGWGDTDGGNIGYVERGNNRRDFRSSHFEQPNVLAHVRFNERTDADGKRVLFIEEVQSDWAQKGKRQGFKSTVARDAAKAFDVKMAEKYGGKTQARDAMTDAELDQRNELFKVAGAEEKQDFGGALPSAPFVTNTQAWVALSLKRMIRYAAENDFDRVAWTNGEQQAARYDLSKQVERVDAFRRDDGRYDFMVTPKGERAYRDISAVNADSLADTVGKELAEKIAQQPAGWHRYAGLDLKVGGTGMKSFYDKIVPNVANDVLKKLGGGRVGEIDLDGAEPVRRNHGWVLERDGKQVAGPFPSQALAEGARMRQPGFDITDTVRDKAMQGMPLFQPHRGAYEVADNLIKIMGGADKSTVVHELGHSWLEEMKADAATAGAPEQIRNDWNTLRRELAIPENGVIDRASHEQFARSVERYLADGRAPSIELRSVFERFRTWLLEIYNDLRNLNVEINPELREVLDRMLATDQEIADARALDVPRAYVGEARAAEALKIVPPPELRRKIEPGFAAEQHSMQPYADELPRGPGEAPDNTHVNYAYINSPMDVKLAMQRMAEIDQANIQEQRGGSAGVKSWAQANAEQARYLNDILGGSNDTLKLFEPRDPDAAHVDVRLGILKKLAVGAAKDSARLRDAVLEAGHDATVRQQLEYMGSIERARMIQAEFLGERASVARALNALKDVTEGSGEIGRMLEAIGLGEEATLYQEARTPAQEQAYMKARLDEIMANYRGRTPLDIARLHKEIGTLKGTFKLAKGVTEASKWEMVVEAWRAGLLSGPVTHTTNLFGTGAFQVMRAPVDMLASMIGMARGASVGMGETDRASMSEGVARLTGMLGGIQDGVKAGYHTFLADEATGKTEQYREAIPGRAGEIIRIPLRLMGAEDAIVGTMYKRGEMKTLAIRQAFDENMNPGTREFAERVDYLMEHPTEQMALDAQHAADRMTFNLPLGEKGVALQGFVRKWNLQWMVPFIRTPINIAKELARMSPFAPLVGEWRAAIAKGGVERDRALAEVALGTGIMALTMAYAFEGNISGAGSPDPGKNRGKAGVWQPYSILIGDKWYEYARIQPTGTLMGLAADIASVWDHMNDEEKDKVPKMLSVAFSNAVTNQTFLQGITNFVNATSDPSRFGPRFVQQFAASLVPNVIGQPTTMADPVVREVNSMLEAIQARIPGFRQDLLPKVDWLGADVQTKERMGFVMPVREQQVSEDKVRLEAARLDISMAAAPKKTHLGKGTGKLGDVELTPEERHTFQKVGGEMAHKILTNIVNAPGYDAIPDLIKSRIFAKVLTASHRVAAVAALPMDKRTSYLQSISEKVAAELQPGEEVQQ